ncbi:MAG: MmgE/PrpD family protein [Gammaproteobacteria bacterium]
MPSYTKPLAEWASTIRFEDLPAAVVENSKFRILDVIGLALAGLGTPFGASIKNAALALNPPGPCHLFGVGQRLGVAPAAFANGALAQALEFDDTHNESIVHMSSPAVAAALALAEYRPVSGRDLLTAVALGNEISCRIGCVAPGQFHRRGFHPTGLFAPFGVAFLAGRLLGLQPEQLVNAAGIVASFAAGVLQCWVDGTQSKFLHPGWAAQSGISAAFLAQAGATGPQEALEGRFGLFASHLQDPAVTRSFDRITAGLGTLWESEKASFKPFPAAHVIHPYIDALLRLRQQHRIDHRQVREIVCPVAAYIVPIVCEPLAEKRRPNTDSHGRVSFQYTLAETLARGELGPDAYRAEALRDPAILRLADVVNYHVDPNFPGPERFKGAVKIIMNDGAVYEAVEEHNRGSAANPMSPAELIAKFEANAAALLSPDQRARLIAAVTAVDGMAAAGELVRLAIAD